MKKRILVLLSVGASLCFTACPKVISATDPIITDTWLSADAVDPGTPAVTARTTGPDDWRDEIIYFIMTDRFYDGDSGNDKPGGAGDPNYDTSKSGKYHGGDFDGIVNKISYLLKLGVTAVWVTPIVRNAWDDGGYTGFHGYWAQDFEQVDPHLANHADWDTTENSLTAVSKTQSVTVTTSFVTALHNQGLLAIQDIVVNHTGNSLLYSGNNWNPSYSSSDLTRQFVDVAYPDSSNSWVKTGNRYKPQPFTSTANYHAHGGISDYNNDTQVVNGDLSGLDDLKTDDSGVRDTLIGIYKAWQNCGFDGFRIDTVKHVDTAFWDSFSPAIRGNAGSKKFFQFGEVFTGAHSQTSTYVSGSRLDSLLNYELYYKMKTVFINGGATSELSTELTDRNTLRTTTIGSGGAEVTAQDGAVNFIDNHDNNRFLTDASGDVNRLRLALMYLLTTKGIPCIYYDTENDVSGSSDSGRLDMPDFTVTGKKTLTLIRKLAQIRKDNISLRRGNMAVLQYSSAPGVFAFVRYNGTPAENVVVILNTSISSHDMAVPLGAYGASGDWHNILYEAFGLSDTVNVSGNTLFTAVEPLSMKIFKQ